MDEGLRIDGINTLRFRIRQYLPRIRGDLELIEKFTGQDKDR